MIKVTFTCLAVIFCIGALVCWSMSQLVMHTLMENQRWMTWFFVCAALAVLMALVAWLLPVRKKSRPQRRRKRWCDD